LSSPKPNLGAYSLVICEKPDAARRVAEALSDGHPRPLIVGGMQAFQLENASGRYVVCAASGHLYGVSDTIANRRVYPVFDVEWFPLDSAKGGSRAERRIRAIQDLCEGATSLVNACDFDSEGETIGNNILRYACNGRKRPTLRTKFSALTKDEIGRAFREAEDDAENLAVAGRLRHVADFLWGVNLSRALAESLRTANGYRKISVGRVQGPTLAFVLEREIHIQTFVPIPYWVVTGVFRKDEAVLEARYSVRKVQTKIEAERVQGVCAGKTGLVSRVARQMSHRPPPAPLNLGDLQRESYRLLGFAPSRTLQIAERLYLGALISYPRTNSQRLPKMDHSLVLQKIGRSGEYGLVVSGLLSRALRPREGPASDSAHPAIHPTGEIPRKQLSREEKLVLGLVTRRYLACFAEEALDEMVSITIAVGSCEFDWVGRRVVSPGWLRVYSADKFEAAGSSPGLKEGDVLVVDKVSSEEKFGSPPSRYNQSSLLEKMERKRVGTKATRADIISTLLERGYVTGESLTPTSLGFSLIETMKEYCPEIVSVQLTRDTERRLESIERDGGDASEFLEELFESLSKVLGTMRDHEPEIADRMRSSVGDAAVARTVLGSCPVCGVGKLRVIRSSKTGKRFVGCTNYPAGCRASAPLPQRGKLRNAARPCRYCRWPVVYVVRGRRPWRLCVNLKCPQKAQNTNEVPNLRKAS